MLASLATRMIGPGKAANVNDQQARKPAIASFVQGRVNLQGRNLTFPVKRHVGGRSRCIVGEAVSSRFESVRARRPDERESES